jgi:glycosyltransferase involved in cell wall biosynthesis
MMNNMPLISVITATYNMARFIAPAMESVLGQTHKKFEHIIIDDGSTDHTKGIVDKFINDPRVKYHYQKNHGQTVAKNRGIRLSSGEYICFLDADNVWTSDKLERQLSVFNELPNGFKILYTDQDIIDENGNVLYIPKVKRYSGKITKELLFDNFVTFNTAMIKRECFEELGYFDEDLPRSIDYELWLRFSTRFKFYYIAGITTHYRVWEGQMSQDKEKRMKYASLITENFIKNNPNLLENKIVRKARSQACTVRGRYWASSSQYYKATKYFLRALIHDPINIFTWKSIIKMLILGR